jgi:hypothetical protein
MQPVTLHPPPSTLHPKNILILSKAKDLASHPGTKPSPTDHPPTNRQSHPPKTASIPHMPSEKPTEPPAPKPAKKNVSKKEARKKDPKGGLTAAGRKAAAKDGSNLRPGVQGPADTPEKQKRKGSFLRRHFLNPRGPMERDGKPTRLALSAHAWGEPVPKTDADARNLAAKGARLLDQYHAAMDEKHKEAPDKKPSVKAVAGKKKPAPKRKGSL